MQFENRVYLNVTLHEIHQDWSAKYKFVSANQHHLFAWQGMTKNVYLTGSPVAKYSHKLTWLFDITKVNTQSAKDCFFLKKGNNSVMSGGFFGKYFKRHFSYCLNFSGTNHKLNNYILIREKFSLHIEAVSTGKRDWMIYSAAAHIFCHSSRAVLKTNTVVSWTEANTVCQSVQGTLPVLRSRDELFDFLFLLQSCRHTPVLRAVYIGLNFNLNKVNIFSTIGRNQNCLKTTSSERRKESGTQTVTLFGYFSGDLRRLRCWRALKERPKCSSRNHITFRQCLWKECVHQFHSQDKDQIGIFWAFWLIRLRIML